MRTPRVAMTLTGVVWCLLGPVPMAWAQWGPDGVPIAATSQSDSRPRIASDFSGGAFVVWSEGGSLLSGVTGEEDGPLVIP